VDVKLLLKPNSKILVEELKNVKLEEYVNNKTPLLLFKVIVILCPFAEKRVCNSVMNVEAL
jgi:hypothetical protein